MFHIMSTPPQLSFGLGNAIYDAYKEVNNGNGKHSGHRHKGDKQRVVYGPYIIRKGGQFVGLQRRYMRFLLIYKFQYMSHPLE